MSQEKISADDVRTIRYQKLQTPQLLTSSGKLIKKGVEATWLAQKFNLPMKIPYPEI